MTLISTCRDRLNTALLTFAWDQWSQLGVFGAPTMASPWAQDPEALFLLTLEVARSDPRLFDEILDWAVRNEPLLSVRRLRTLCHDDTDRALTAAALEYAGRHRNRQRPLPQAALPTAAGPTALYRDIALPVTGPPDPAFLRHGLLRPLREPSGKSQAPDFNAAIALPLRLRQLLGVGARAEVISYLLTADAPPSSTQTITQSAAFAKRNVHEALTALSAARVITTFTADHGQRHSIDRARWATLLGVPTNTLPNRRAWPQLLGALRSILRWLWRNDLDGLSNYLLASTTADLIDTVQGDLAHAGVHLDAPTTAETAWTNLESLIDGALQLIDATSAPVPSRRWSS